VFREQFDGGRLRSGLVEAVPRHRRLMYQGLPDSEAGFDVGVIGYFDQVRILAPALWPRIFICGLGEVVVGLAISSHWHRPR
jgi:hypothetical protein